MPDLGKKWKQMKQGKVLDTRDVVDGIEMGKKVQWGRSHVYWNSEMLFWCLFDSSFEWWIKVLFIVSSRLESKFGV